VKRSTEGRYIQESREKKWADTRGVLMGGERRMGKVLS
jgi:hypothetical protein